MESPFLRVKIAILTFSMKILTVGFIFPPLQL